MQTNDGADAPNPLHVDRFKVHPAGPPQLPRHPIQAHHRTQAGSQSKIDIFNKFGGHLLSDLSHALAKIKLNFYVCVSISWLIFSLKIGEVGYFVQFSKYIHQNW